MIWLLACTGGEPEAVDPPQGAAYEGPPKLVEHRLDCVGEQQSWQVAGRGVAELELALLGSWSAGEPDSGLDTGGGDTAVNPAIEVDELHELALEDQDPAGWWSLYTLELQYAPGDPGVGHSAAPCSIVESDLSWTLTLRSSEGETLDCLGSCP